MVRGAAVVQIWGNFRQRWNDTTPPAKWPSPLPIVVPPAITEPTPSSAPYGSHHVQVLRTLACRGGDPFAPNGEQTARKGLERAIVLAQHYIYIEEQFLWPCTVVDGLRNAVKRNPALKVVIILAEELEFGFPLRAVHHEMRNEAISAIIGSSTGQVFVYCLEQPFTKNPIYVHSKLTIIDNCFVAIGSVNVNKRSLTTDAELHISIVDADLIPGRMNGTSISVCQFAKELRVALWASTACCTSNGSRTARPASTRSGREVTRATQAPARGEARSSGGWLAFKGFHGSSAGRSRGLTCAMTSAGPLAAFAAASAASNNAAVLTARTNCRPNSLANSMKSHLLMTTYGCGGFVGLLKYDGSIRNCS